MINCRTAMTSRLKTAARLAQLTVRRDNAPVDTCDSHAASRSPSQTGRRLHTAVERESSAPRVLHRTTTATTIHSTSNDHCNDHSLHVKRPLDHCNDHSLHVKRPLQRPFTPRQSTTATTIHSTPINSTPTTCQLHTVPRNKAVPPKKGAR